MLWEVEEEQGGAAAPAEAVDVAFPLRGRALPEAYAAPLAEALALLLAPLVEPRRVGVRVAHIPAAGHGWQRVPGRPILLSRRTRLILRVPREQGEAVAGLAGAQLSVAGEPLALGRGQSRELPAAEPVYAHRVLGLGEDEETLLAEARARLRAAGLYPRRMLCGRPETLYLPDGPVTTRSLLLDGMGAEAGQRLQAYALGEGACWGCGLFIPHKAVT